MFTARVLWASARSETPAVGTGRRLTPRRFLWFPGVCSRSAPRAEHDGVVSLRRAYQEFIEQRDGHSKMVGALETGMKNPDRTRLHGSRVKVFDCTEDGRARGPFPHSHQRRPLQAARGRCAAWSGRAAGGQSSSNWQREPSHIGGNDRLRSADIEQHAEVAHRHARRRSRA